MKQQGWCSVESTRLQPMWSGFDSRSRCHMWVEFVIGSLLAPRGFSPGAPVFPSPQKPTLSNNLVPRVSHLNAWGERGETLVGSGHVSPRIWEMTIYPMKGGAA